jgi:hypothetical protein
VLLTHPRSLAHLLEDSETDLRPCVEVAFDHFNNRPLFRRLRDSISRLVAPLL